MKKAITILLAGLMLMSAAACDQSVGIIGGADGPTAIIVGSAEEPEQLPARIEHEYSNNHDEYMTHYMTLKAYDENGALMWEYVTPDSILAQCETLEYLGMENGLVYINENGIYEESMGDDLSQLYGRLRTLNAADGTVVWDNTEYGGSCSDCVFDEEGNIYLTGYFGPDCMKVDCVGKTVWIRNGVDPSLYWSYNISLENDVVTISYEASDNGDGGTVRLSVDGEILD